MNMFYGRIDTKTLKSVFTAFVVLLLSACSSSNDDTVATAETATEIPQFIRPLALTSADGNLLAWITIDGGTRTPMAIDSTLGTASASIPELSMSAHNVLIEFEFTDGVTTVTLATATTVVDLTTGDTNHSFADADYTINFDDDNDGIYNVDEIISGTDPLVADITEATLDILTEIPQFLLDPSLLATDGNLLAWVTIDGGTRIPMAINSTAGTVSVSIPDLSLTTHDVLVEFEFTNGVYTVVVATVTRTVDLTTGDDELSFVDGDYVTSIDTDGDGIFNLVEITNGTDPTVADVAEGCVLYVSKNHTNASDANPGTMVEPFASIQAAIQAADSDLGCEVRVATATYNVNSALSPPTHIVMRNKVSLYGGYSMDWAFIDVELYETRIIDNSSVGGTMGAPNKAVEFTGTIIRDTILEGFTIRGGGGDVTSAVLVSGTLADGPTIRGNKLLGGSSLEDSFGIYSDESSPLITDNYIEGGFTANSSTAVSITGQYPIVAYNDIRGGNGSQFAKGLVDTLTSAKVYNNTIYAGTAPTTWGVMVYNTSTAYYNNTINGGDATLEATGMLTWSVSPIRNNIIFTTSTNTTNGEVCIAEYSTLDSISIQNNDLFGCATAIYTDNEGGCTGNADGDNDSTTCTLAEMESLSVQHTDNISEDPGFIDIARFDWHLSSQTPLSVSQGGLDLSSNFTDDKDHRLRVVPWTMGAYEEFP